MSSENDPDNLPHRTDDTDLVLEAAGTLRHRQVAKRHLRAGAENVLVTPPPGDEIDGDFIIGVNNEEHATHRHRFISIRSCTTSCRAPMGRESHD